MDPDPDPGGPKTYGSGGSGSGSGSATLIWKQPMRCCICDSSEFSPSILRHSGIWSAADEEVADLVYSYIKNTTRFWLRIGRKFLNKYRRKFQAGTGFGFYSIKHGIFRAEVFSYGNKQCCGSEMIRIRILFSHRSGSGSGSYPKTGPSM